MPFYKTPTAEEVDRAVAMLARPEQRRYFFERLENPTWLAPLEQRRFFSEPPAPIKDDEKGTVQFPPWPATQYLARMARIPDAHQDVFRIANDIPDTENISVHENLADVAAQLPAGMAAQLARKAASWLASPYHRLLAEKLGTLIDHLARNGEPAAAARLARVTLALTNNAPADLTAHFDPWHYQRIIAIITPTFVQHLGLDALTLFSDLLQTAAPSYTKDGRPTGEDGSRIWHSKIELDEDLHGVRNLLVSATRNVAAQLAIDNPGAAAHVIATLNARPTKVFYRIALDILRRVQATVPELVRAQLTNRNLFDDVSLKHEYQRLLHDVFPHLPPQDQETILMWINDGPPQGQYESWEAFVGQAPTPERATQYRQVWQRGHLVPIADSLRPVWAERYEAIIAAVGPEKKAPEEGFVGPQSPLTKEALVAKTPAELITYFRTWEPPGDFFGPSRSGIGMDLTSIITDNPAHLDEVIDELRTLSPTYVRSYFYGLRAAIEKGKTIAWPRVLNLATWVVNEPYVPPAQRDPFGDDQDWGSTRSAIADVIDLALTKEVPFEHRTQVWEIISSLANDPEPSIALEQEQPRDFDAASLAINTTRGKAIEGVIKYALWVRRHEPGSRTFDTMPEVRTVLTEHLEHDESRAIRSVYGRFFPWLVSLDHVWTAEHTDDIFTGIPGVDAWDAYLTFSPAYDDAVALLPQYYERAVAALPGPPQPARQHKPDAREHLGEHLMAQYWRGQLPLDHPLIQRFFAQASPTVRAHAMAYIGRNLYASRDSIVAPIQERLVALWNDRKQAAIANLTEHRGELTAFGWWFAAGKLDAAWELAELREVLQRAHRTDHDYFVLSRLAQLAPTHTLPVLECLREMIKTEHETWTILGAEANVQKILEAGLASSDPAGHTLASSLINELGVLGYAKYRTLHQHS